MLVEYKKPEVEVIVFDIDDVRMQSLLSRFNLDRKSVFSDDLLVDFWEDGV